MNSLSIDIETFSSENLARSGVYRYAEAPDFRVLLFGYRADDGPVRVVDLASGETLPTEVLSALQDDSVVKWAFNAAFERVCLSRYLRDLGLLKEGEFISPASWRCSMVWCAYLGLPLSLASAGEALGLEKQKLSEGKKLIKLFCEFHPEDGSGASLCWFSNGPLTHPEKWQEFRAYNLRDVETECEIKERLVHYPVPDSVWAQYVLDQQINDRGIRVDLLLVSGAMALDAESRETLGAELQRLTSLVNPNSVAQIRQWLSDHGTEAPDLSKKQVKDLLSTADGEVRNVLLLRQQLAKSSVKKYQAMADTVCADGRIRGMFQFYGASRSGRWAGRGVQLQNLPQNHMPDLKTARDLVVYRDGESLNLQYDSVPDVLSELIRTAFVPAPGKKFIVADFSAIEARVIAWLAGETWRSEVFASGGDIYCASASKMFGVPVEKHGVNGHLRQKGKVAELALGYGGGVGALKAMGALEMGVPEDELQSLVSAWRSASPNIVRLWWNVDSAVKKLLHGDGSPVRVFSGRNSFGSVISTGAEGEAEKSPRRSDVPLLSFFRRSGMLFIQLPSGRYLSYVRPRIGENRFGGESVTYLGLGPARKWERIESYGPKFVENIVQGIARDLLAEAMLRLEGQGYHIVGHVHDEVIIEADPETRVDDVCRIMGETPCWANLFRPPVAEISKEVRSTEASELPSGESRRLRLRTEGLLLRADGYECEFYRKD